MYRVQSRPSSRIVRLLVMRSDACRQGVVLTRLVETGDSVAVSLDVGVPIPGAWPVAGVVCAQAVTPFCVSVDLGRRLGGRAVLAGTRRLAVPSLTATTSYGGALGLARGDCPRIAVGSPVLA